MTPHESLRSATRAAHDAVDARFSALDLSDPGDYRRFLAEHAAAFLPAERALDEAGAARIIPMWSELRRGPLLIADLADLAIAPPDPRRHPAYRDDATVLGGAYVLEGSRLGGAMLRRSVDPALPRRFLDAIQPPGRWRAFVAILDRSLYQPEALARATEAALATFAMFGDPGSSVNE